MALSRKRLAEVRCHWVKGCRWLSQNYQHNLPIGEGYEKEGAAKRREPPS